MTTHDLTLRDVEEDDLPIFFEQQLDPLGLLDERPLHARAAKDNLGSLRVLEKCGFRIIGEDRGYSEARGAEVEEYILRLDEYHF